MQASCRARVPRYLVALARRVVAAVTFVFDGRAADALVRTAVTFGRAAATTGFGRDAQKLATAFATDSVISVRRSGAISCNSSSRLMIDPASSRTAGIRVIRSTIN